MGDPKQARDDCILNAMSTPVDQNEVVRSYLQEKRVPQLLQRLSASVLFHRPDDPRAFLLKQLEALKSGQDMLFTDEDLQTMFGMFDIVRKGHITVDQYKQAMATLGINNPADPASSTVTYEEFAALAKDGLAGSAKAYTEGR